MSPFLLVFRTGHESFHLIQLLSSLVIVIDTWKLWVLCVSLIVTMQMQGRQVSDIILSSLAFGRDMVEFYQVCIFEKESTPFTFSLLFLEDPSESPCNDRMISQSRAPVKKVSIIWACCPFHFDVPLDVRLGVLPELLPLLGLEFPAFAFFRMPVFVERPVDTFVWVPSFCP